MDSRRSRSAAGSSQARDGERKSNIAQFVTKAAVILRLTFAQALEHSFERLKAMSAEKRKENARRMLRLAQLIVVGTNGKPETWDSMQQDLIEQITEDDD